MTAVAHVIGIQFGDGIDVRVGARARGVIGGSTTTTATDTEIDVYVSNGWLLAR